MNFVGVLSPLSGDQAQQKQNIVSQNSQVTEGSVCKQVHLPVYLRLFPSGQITDMVLSLEPLWWAVN